MDVLGDGVVSDDQAIEDGDVVAQFAGRGMGRDPPQALDDLALVQARTSLAIASSRPLTKPLSRLS
jgi:hypothetical protein